MKEMSFEQGHNEDFLYLTKMEWLLVAATHAYLLQAQLAKLLNGQSGVQACPGTSHPQSVFPYPTQPFPPFPPQLLPSQPHLRPVWISPSFGMSTRKYWINTTTFLGLLNLKHLSLLWMLWQIVVIQTGSQSSTKDTIWEKAKWSDRVMQPWMLQW